MASKTLHLAPDVYDSLVTLKAEGESFSDVILRLTRPRLPLSPFAGAWRGAPPEAMADLRKFLREADRLDRAKFRRLGAAPTPAN